MKPLCIILILFFLIEIVSCQNKTKENLVKQNAEAYIKRRLSDPSSYEFAELQLIDSTFYRDNIKFRKDSFRRQLASDKDDLGQQRRYKRQGSFLYDKSGIKRLEASITENQKILLEINAIEKSLGAKVNDVAAYKYIFSFRNNNGFGAKVLNEFFLQTSGPPDYKVLNMTTERDKLFLNPNEFPGYQEMITKYIVK